MGTFHVDCTIENVAERTRRATVSKLLVDTGSEHTWAPASVLEGMNLTVDAAHKKLVAAGPLPAAVQLASSSRSPLTECHSPAGPDQ